MNTKTFFKEIAYYAFFPLLIIGAAVVTQVTTSNSHAVFIAACIAMVLYVCSVTPIKPDYNQQTDHQNQTALVTLAFAAVLMWYLTTFSLDLNPWGAIGWVCLIGISVVILILIFRDVIINDEDELKVFSQIAMRVLSMIFAIAASYLLFGSQLIWVPLVAYALQTLFILSRLRKFDVIENKNVIGTFAGTFLIGTISTAVQFWFTPIVFGLQLWKILATIITLVAFYVIYEYLQSRKKKKEAERIASEKDAIEQAEALKQRNAQLAVKKEKKENEIIRAEELFVQLNKIEIKEIEWQQLEFILQTLYFGVSPRKSLPHNLMVKARFTKLVTISKFKNQIIYNGSEFKNAMFWINRVFDECGDDNILEVFKSDFKELEQYSACIGYQYLLDDIYSKDRDFHHIRRWIHMKPADTPPAALLDERKN